MDPAALMPTRMAYTFPTPPTPTWTEITTSGSNTYGIYSKNSQQHIIQNDNITNSGSSMSSNIYLYNTSNTIINQTTLSKTGDYPTLILDHYSQNNLLTNT